MKTASRWRNWKPGVDEKFDTHAKNEVPEVPKLSTTPDESLKKFTNMPGIEVPEVPKASAVTKESSSGTSGTFGTATLAEHDPDAWHDDFSSWILAHCIFRDRVFWSVRHLHGLFCAWCLSTDRVPCRLDTFEALLRGEDFLLADGLIAGVMPKEKQATVDEIMRDARSADAQ